MLHQFLTCFTHLYVWPCFNCAWLIDFCQTTCGFQKFCLFGHTHMHTQTLQAHYARVVKPLHKSLADHSFQIICWTHLSLCFCSTFWFSGLLFTQEWTECGFMYLKHSNCSYEALDPFQACLNQGDFDEDKGKIESLWWQFYGMFMSLGLQSTYLLCVKDKCFVQKITRNNY